MNMTQKRNYRKPRAFTVVLTDELLWQQNYSITGGVDDTGGGSLPNTTKPISRHYWEL